VPQNSILENRQVLKNFTKIFKTLKIKNPKFKKRQQTSKNSKTNSNLYSTRINPQLEEQLTQTGSG
jgi:hypothetical protein